MIKMYLVAIGACLLLLGLTLYRSGTFEPKYHLHIVAPSVGFDKVYTEKWPLKTCQEIVDKLLPEVKGYDGIVLSCDPA